MPDTRPIAGYRQVGNDIPALVDQHRSWLTRVVAARTGSRDAIDEVLQEVALAVTRSENPPACDEQVRPWLCTIAIRQCALLLRKAGRANRLVSRATAQVVHGSRNELRDDPIFWLLAQESETLVRRSLDALDEQQRGLLVWKYVDGLTYPEISRRLGVSRHVAEYRVVVAKKALRKLFLDMGLAEEGMA
jgi:RNA polymerase sigma-70 factor (ECF subfamily)